MPDAALLDAMPPAALPDEDEQLRRERLARLPLPNSLPPAPVGPATPQTPAPKAAMPPAPAQQNPAPTQTASAIPPAPIGAPPSPSPQPAAPVMPAAPVNPAMKQYQDLQAQGPPKLPWWKQALDVIGSLHPIGREIEAGIPGSPQNYSARLNQAAVRAAAEQNLGKGEQEIAASKSKQGIEEQQAKMVPVPGHPELGNVEEKSLPALLKQLEANQGKTDTADINQTAANERNQARIDAKPAVAAGLKFGVLKPDIVAQIGPMPEDPAAQQEWGKKYDELAGKGAQRTGLGTYAMVRLLDWATKYNPELLKMMPEILKGAGLNMPAGMNLRGIPAGLPQNEAGQVIGTATPGAPTTQTRTAGQAAQRVITEMPRIRKEVDDLKGYLGPGEGRLNIGFLLGKVGSTGDPHKDQVLSQLRTDLVFMHSAAAKFHINSVRAIDDFEKTAEAGKDSAQALQGALDSIEPWAKTAAKQGRGEPSNAEVQVHQGYEYTKGSDGLWHRGNKAKQ
jgi:hypothetical protein